MPAPLCPPFCGTGGGKGRAALISRKDNSMEII
jgi:hypothetical protein